MDVLLADFIDFALQGLINLLKVLKVFMFVVHAALEECTLALDLADELVVIDLVEGVVRDLLRAIREDAIELGFIVLADILALLQLPSNLQKLLDQL